jgi:hypothetical protein
MQHVKQSQQATCSEHFLHIWVPVLTSWDSCCTLFTTASISHFSSNFASWEHLYISAGPFYTTGKTFKLSGCHKHIFLFCSSNIQLCPTVRDFANKNTWSSSLAKICPHWHSTNGFPKHNSGSVWKWVYICLCILSCMCAQSCATFCDSLDSSPPSSTVQEIFPERILKWVAISYSRGILPTQGSNPPLLHLPHGHTGSLRLCHQGSPGILNYYFYCANIFDLGDSGCEFYAQQLWLKIFAWSTEDC